MKVQQELRKVETEGFEHEAKKFQISQNKRMFEILSSNIYSDKILAVIREYGCNAYDAHVAAGKGDVPFTVHLPNSIEPWFSVKDYAMGLCHEDVMGLYSTYGYSTKNEDNNAIGMLGLGSKSGFAYSDQFVVTSVFEGVSRIYSAFVDQDGSPTITLLSEEETQEQSGLEINIPVKESDYQHFADKAAKVFFRFPVQPEIVGNVIELPKVSYPMEGKHFKIRLDNRSYYDKEHGAYAIQGVVSYPIKISAFNSDDLTYEMKQLLQDIPIDITFPIGSLDVAASREGLNYDKFTQANIIKAAQEILDEIPNQFRDVLSGCKTLWEAKVFYAQWINDQKDYSKILLGLSKQGLEWQGQSVESNTIHVELFDLVDTDKIDPISNKPFKESKEWGMCSYFSGKDLNSFERAAPSHVLRIGVIADDDTVILFDDKPLKAPVRSTSMLFSGKKRVYLFRDVKPENKQRLLDALGNPPDVIYTSTLTEPPPEPREVKSKSNIRTLYRIKQFCSRNIDGEECDIDVSEGGVYLLGYKSELISPLANESDPNLVSNNAYRMVANLVHRFNIRDIAKDPIYFFNSTHRKIAETNPKWVSFFKVMEPRVREIFSKKNKDLIKAFSFFHEIQVGDYEKLKNYVRFIEKLDRKNTLDKFPKEFVSYIEVFRKNKDIINSFFNISKDLDYYMAYSYHFFVDSDLASKYFKGIKPIKPIDFSKSMDKIVEKIESQYPLFFSINSRYNTNLSDDQILHYLMLSKSSKKCVKDYVSTLK